MPGGLLKKLGLKRKKTTQPQGNAPPVNAPVQQQPPVVQQPPQQQPPAPQRPVVPPRPPQRPQQPPPLTPPVLKRQEAFEKTLAAIMPEIRRAKQLALTVDGKRIELAKKDGESKFAKTFTELAGKLTPQIKVIDGHSSIVRQKAEALDFDEAEKELTKAHHVA